MLTLPAARACCHHRLVTPWPTSANAARHLSMWFWSTKPSANGQQNLATTQTRLSPNMLRNILWSLNASPHNSESTRRLNAETRRKMHSSPASRHGHITRPEPGTGIQVHFKDSKGKVIRTVEGNEGDDLLSIAHEHDIDLEGACEGSVACSTCHVVLDVEHYDLLPEPTDEENDMLDLAFGLTDTSRLGCQVVLTKDLHGMTATLPSATRNMFVDGKKPTHH